MIAVKQGQSWDAIISDKEALYIKRLVQKDLREKTEDASLAIGILKEIEEQEQTSKGANK